MSLLFRKSVFIFLIPVAVVAQEVLSFDQYFIDKTMRIDYYHTGDAQSEIIACDKIYQYGIWAGSRVHLLDSFNNGRYYANIYDVNSGKLVFSRGFDSYFAEYQSSEPARKGVKKTFHESMLIPSPKTAVVFKLASRDRRNQLHTIYADTIDPASAKIIRHEFTRQEVKILKPVFNGDPHKKVDIVILAEGYTHQDEDKFSADLNRVIDVFFSQDPYKIRKSDFNFYGLYLPSEDSGIDEPRAGIYKQTSLSTTFNSMGSERYVLTEDNKALRDLAAHMPYDAIYIMVNHHRYGGGGIYNLFCTFTLDKQWMAYLFTHEFGHSFAGLADEYYSSPTAYLDFFPAGIEPCEPNITALLDPANIKWKDLLSKNVQIPTSWHKAAYDSVNFTWQKLRISLNLQTEKLKKQRATQAEIRLAEEKYAFENKKASDLLDAIIADDPNSNQVGAFEGAGYSSSGLYRSMADCMMFSTGMKPFCAACRKRVNQVIDHYME